METQTHPPKNSTRKDVYQIVTERIIDQLNKGTVPWRKPWNDGGLPRNLITGRPYRGINLMLLAMLGYEQNLFLTSKNLKEFGGTIKPDEKPHIIVYWNYYEEEMENEVEKKKTPFLRYYTVFNIAQCNGIPAQYLTKERDTVELPSCESVIKRMPTCPPIKSLGKKACYDPVKDIISMPKKASFESDESYYSTLFHEMAHSTGHNSRLDRKELMQMSEFGSEPYSHEELVAEIATCYLQSHCGITCQFEQSAAYIQGWLSKLRNDPRFIFSAARHAQKAVDYILNIKNESEEMQQK